MIFGDNYTDLRNKYIIPLIAYELPVSKSQYWDFKNTLITKLTSFTPTSQNEFIITIDSNDFFKALLNDIELFSCKSYIQFIDFIKNNNTLSPTWSYVTQYYLNFFSLTYLSRILHRGFIYLDETRAKELSSTASFVSGNLQKYDASNYYFELLSVNASNVATVIVKKKGGNVHQQSWSMMAALIEEFKKNTNDPNELIIYESFSNANSFYNRAFPSDLRNDINYRGDYALRDLFKEFENSPSQVFTQKNLLQTLSGITLKKTDSIQTKMKVASLYGYYLFILANELHEEYKLRSRKNKSFETLRMDYLKNKNIPKSRLIS